MFDGVLNTRLDISSQGVVNSFMTEVPLSAYKFLYDRDLRHETVKTPK